MVAWPLLLLWGGSEAFSNWLDQPLPEDGLRIGPRDEALLRSSALRTWRFFREFSNEQENYLIPDILKEEGGLIAHRVSTTNLGLLLNARIAALDLGHLTVAGIHLLARENTMATVRRLPKSHGHLYNWYDTRTLEPVGDPFLSTVDNGNLVCCLWTLKQASLEEWKRPIFRKELVDRNSRPCPAGSCRLWEPKKSRKAFRSHSKTASRNMGATPFEWLAALPVLEQSVDFADRSGPRIPRNSPDDLQWWMAELNLRLAELEKLTVQFAPWASTKFRTLRASAGTAGQVDCRSESGQRRAHLLRSRWNHWTAKRE